MCQVRLHIERARLGVVELLKTGRMSCLAGDEWCWMMLLGHCRGEVVWEEVVERIQMQTRVLHTWRFARKMCFEIVGDGWRSKEDGRIAEFGL